MHRHVDFGNKAPIIVHTGVESGNSLKLDIFVTKHFSAASTDEARILQSLKVIELQKALDGMHKEMNITLSDSRKKASTRHNSRARVYPCNPILGDYMVAARTR